MSQHVCSRQGGIALVLVSSLGNGVSMYSQTGADRLELTPCQHSRCSRITYNMHIAIGATHGMDPSLSEAGTAAEALCIQLNEPFASFMRLPCCLISAIAMCAWQSSGTAPPRARVCDKAGPYL